MHQTGATGQYAMPEVMGAGLALLDYDGDGDLDVFLVQGGTLAEGAGTGAAGSRLFRNDLRKDDPRSLRFTDVTPKAGFGPHGYGMGAATGDYDGDGDLDVYVTAFGRDALYRNDGSGTFTDVTDAAGVDDPRWSTSAAFVDYDRDGDLDLFVANYLAFTLAANKVCTDAAGARDYCSPQAYRPVPDRLFRNEGQGRFTDVTEVAGISRAFGAGLGVAVGDYNGDGWLDLYVANDATPNQLWLNQRNGTFADDGLLAGAAVNAAGAPEGSMGIASGDYDADGDEDLFVTNIVGETHVLYANDGTGTFEDARVRAGTAAPTAAMTGFGTAWLDVDHDGWLDLFVANGAVNAIAAQRGTPLPFRMRNLLLRNTGMGRLVDVSATSGTAFARMDIGRGTAAGDLDNDGDIDSRGDQQQWAGTRAAQHHRRGAALAAAVTRGPGRQPVGVRRARRHPAGGPSHTLAPGGVGRKLPVGERCPCPRRAWLCLPRDRGGGALARRGRGALRGLDGQRPPRARAWFRPVPWNRDSWDESRSAAPRGQGATRKDIGHIRARSNAAPGDAPPGNHPRNHGSRGHSAGARRCPSPLTAMSPLTAARIQMELSLGFHMIFAAIGVAMPLLMLIAEWRWIRHQDADARRLAHVWAKLTAVTFAIGAVSGTALSFELGLLWPRFMAFAGPLIGPAFALEGYAFFIEAIFLGLYLYGWERLPPRQHWWCGVAVAVSGAVSAIMVLAVNAWMQNPVGFTLSPTGAPGRRRCLGGVRQPGVGADGGALDAVVLPGGRLRGRRELRLDALARPGGRPLRAARPDDLDGGGDRRGDRDAAHRRPAGQARAPPPAGQAGGRGGALRDAAPRAADDRRLAGRRAPRDVVRDRDSRRAQLPRRQQPRDRGDRPRPHPARSVAQRAGHARRLPDHGRRRHDDARRRALVLAGVGGARAAARRRSPACCWSRSSCAARSASSRSRPAGSSPRSGGSRG